MLTCGTKDCFIQRKGGQPKAGQSTMNMHLYILIIAAISSVGAQLQPTTHTIPEGTESVNGSDVYGGCPSPPGFQEVCGPPNAGTISYLIDGIIPVLNTAAPNWASQLVTVRKSSPTVAVPYDHVLLVFNFDLSSPVSLIVVDLYLFNCPEWNIGAPNITVYVDEDGENQVNYVQGAPGIAVRGNVLLSQSSCDSLLPVRIPLENISTQHYTWYIVVSFEPQPDIEWVHIGEVQLFDTEPPPPTVPTTGPYTTSSMDTPTTVMTTSSDPAPLPSTAGDFTPTTTSIANTVTPTITSSPNPPAGDDNAAAVAGDNSAAVAAGVGGGLAVALLLALILAVVILIFMYRRRRQYHKVELENLQSVVVEHKHSRERKVREEYEFENPHYSSVEAARYQTHKQPGVHDTPSVNNPMYSTAGKSLSPPALPDYAEIDEVKNGTINRMQHNNIDEKIPSYDYIAVAEIKRKSPSPAPNQSAPEPPVYSAVQKQPPPVVLEKSPQPDTDLQSKKKDQPHSPIYSAVKKEEAPVVPQKSPALEEYLATRDATGHNNLSETDGKRATPAPQSPPKLATLNRPVVGMARNPIYHSSDEIPTLSSHSTDNTVYAEPVLGDGPPTTAHPGHESIYSEPINPSDFMRGSSPDEGVEPQVYAPVYTVPSSPLESHLQPLQVTLSNIQEREVLGSGQFGQVILAATKGLSLKDMKLSDTDDNQKISILVAVKKLKPNAHKGQREVFDKEVKFMSHLKHGNVVSLLGVCYSEPAFIMMEYMEEGDLSQFLQRYSEIIDAPTSKKTQISTSTLIHMATQISSAMKYLASLNFVHRDLATRNCLVGQNFVIKLADFGLSRNLYQAQYYRIQGNAILPIRWMATECYYGKFSEKTDVWSFGVTMWELFTLAKEQPYAAMKDKEVIDDAIKGAHRQLLSRPSACPQPVYQIMMQCWVAEAEQRVTFETLYDELMALNEVSQ